MKKMRYTLLSIVSLAAVLFVNSCTPEEPVKSNGSDPEGRVLRELTLNVAGTKTAYSEGNTVWEENDVIKLSDGEDIETATVKKKTSDGSFYIETYMIGPITAVYPADAAYSIDDKEIKGVKVPSSQDGSFAKANICIAKQTVANSSVLNFQNATAIFKIETQDITAFSISSTDKICGDNIEVSFSESNISNVSGANGSTITLTGGFSGGECFVALAPGAALNSLTFTKQDGSKKTVTADGTITINKMYTVSAGGYTTE